MSNIFNRKSFTKKYRGALNGVYNLSASVEDAPNIMIRVNTAQLSATPNLPGFEHYDDIDTFVVTTSADPENTIIYTSGKNDVNWNVKDGGYF